MFKLILAAAVVVAGTGFALSQSSKPTLGTLVEGSSTVSGKAAPGKAPVAIFDISSQVRTKIGLAQTLADDGSFSTPVRPSLVKGHQVVAVDSHGNTRDRKGVLGG